MELPITKYNHDEKQEEEPENFDEINPNLLKIIDKYHDKINSITTTINISEIIGYISFLIFLLMLTIRLAPNINFNWLILLAPSLTCLFSFTILLNMYLKLKDLFDESEHLREEKNSSLGSILSYFCLNTGSLCIIIFLILISLRLQNIIMIKINEIAIPLYIFSGIALFYYIFIFPAFIKNKIIFPLVMFGVYILTGFIFSVMLNTRLDNISNTLFIFCFISILLGVLFHIVVYIYLLVIANKNTLLNVISVLFSLSLLFTALILIPLKLDNAINIYNWIPMVMIIFSYVILISDKLFNFFDKTGSENNKNDLYLSNNFDNDIERHY